MKEFELKLNQSITRFFEAVKLGGMLALLIGDKRQNGKYYPLLRTWLMNQNIGQLKASLLEFPFYGLLQKFCLFI